MNCPEFIDILKSGQPIILRRHSKEYIRLTDNSLSVIAESGMHACLWLAANRKFKRIIRSVSLDNNGKSWKIDTLPLFHFRDITGFLRRWEEMRQVRNWAPTANFPDLTEIAAFVYLTLIPEYWTIYLELAGKPAEEALPLIEHESLHSDSGGYDA
jgi:hypothetical protein